MANIALAVPLAHDDFDTFLTKSKAEPQRLYMLKVSATWCRPCTIEAETLKSYPADKKSAINSAYWNEVETDLLTDGMYEAFLEKIGITSEGSIPFNIAFKNGIPIASITGADMAPLESLVNDAEAHLPSARSEKSAITPHVPAMACGPSKNVAVSVLGISGYLNESNADTDDFGRTNLMSFSSSFPKRSSSRLFAPAPSKISKQTAPSGEGIFYVSNPFLSMSESFEDPKSSLIAIESLDQVRDEDLRIILTGHGSLQGMTVGYKKQAGSGYSTEVTLDAESFEKGIVKARQANKEVRGLLLQCYAGQYGDAFLPIEGVSKPACAIFATLPEKKSEGCYSNEYSGKRKDYLGIAMQLKNCDGSQNARDLHYAVVAAATGQDVPMLSSEYFLISGAAGKKLARQTVVDPIKAISWTILSSGAIVHFNRLTGSVFKASYEGKPIALPHSTLISCNKNAYGGMMDWEAPDHHHFSLFYLWKRSVGPGATKQGDCTPVYRLSWPKRPGNPIRSSELSFDFSEGSTSNLTDEDKTLDVSGLKPEAQLIVSRILPYFRERTPNGGEDRQNFVRNIAAEVKPFDAEQAQAIERLLDKVEEQDKAAGYKRDLDAAMLYNINSADIRENDIALQRLAHLVSAAIAELELRKEAQTDPEAETLVKQLEALKACEKDIL